MRKMLAVLSLAVMVTALVGCGGGKPTDGGWLATGSNWALYLQLSGNSGTADYANHSYGTTSHNHTDFVEVNNGNVIAFSMTDFDYGFHSGCVDGCQYDISNGTLTLHLPGDSNSGASDTGRRDLTFKSATSSDFDNAVQNLEK